MVSHRFSWLIGANAAHHSNDGRPFALQGPHAGPPARDPGRLVERERCYDVNLGPLVGPSPPVAGLATIFFSIARPRRAQESGD